MSGETSLDKLLSSMSPRLNPGEFVFCTVQDGIHIPAADMLGSFREQEGLTVILERIRADALGLSYGYCAAWITLEVHSSLEAIGLTAAFAGALGKAGISCNVVAAYYHDHIFVALQDAERAMQVLRELAGE